MTELSNDLLQEKQEFEQNTGVQATGFSGIGEQFMKGISIRAESRLLDEMCQEMMRRLTKRGYKDERVLSIYHVAGQFIVEYVRQATQGYILPSNGLFDKRVEMEIDEDDMQVAIKAQYKTMDIMLSVICKYLKRSKRVLDKYVGDSESRGELSTRSENKYDMHIAYVETMKQFTSVMLDAYGSYARESGTSKEFMEMVSKKKFYPIFGEDAKRDQLKEDNNGGDNDATEQDQ